MESISLRHGFALSFSKGFTLIELVVVTAIIGVVMSIVLTGQSTFNNTLILQNAAYDIALTLRNAQTFGLGSRVQGSSMNMNVGYGVHFDTSNKGSFILFADTAGSGCHAIPPDGADSPDAQPGDCVYTAGDYKVTEYNIGNGITVKALCVDGDCTQSSLDVVFARPNTETFIAGDASRFFCLHLRLFASRRYECGESYIGRADYRECYVTMPMKKSRGYTLIELIVAVGLFAVIMTLVSGAYIVMISVTERAQGMASGIDIFICS